jgi:hypothetical protein
MRYEIDVKKLLDSCGGGVEFEEGKSRMNHDDCPAGVDTRRRLYLLVKPDRSVLAHCFNCNGSGAYFPDHPRYKSLGDLLREDNDLRNTEVSGWSASLAETIMTDCTHIHSLHIKAWLYKHHIFEDDWEELGLKEWSTNLIFPLNTPATVGGSFQIRNFHSGNRYMNYLRDDKLGNRIWQGECLGAHAHGKVVVTEDILSAYRIHRDLRVESRALLGTNVPDDLIEWFKENHTHVYIWLDGDMTGLSASLKVYKEIDPVLSSTSIVQAEKSPKEYTPEELQEIAKKVGLIT